MGRTVDGASETFYPFRQRRQRTGDLSQQDRQPAHQHDVQDKGLENHPAHGAYIAALDGGAGDHPLVCALTFQTGENDAAIGIETRVGAGRYPFTQGLRNIPIARSFTRDHHQFADGDALFLKHAAQRSFAF